MRYRGGGKFRALMAGYTLSLPHEYIKASLFIGAECCSGNAVTRLIKLRVI